MARAAPAAVLTQAQARAVWLRAQGLDRPSPFGDDAAATARAIEHLGYVQIDTINVIERCHHHILWSRIPGYRRSHLAEAQSVDKSVFEYWTHALSYVPARDIRHFLADMRLHREAPRGWFAAVARADIRAMLARIRDEGPLSIRDVDTDALKDKEHPWGSRKPSKAVLECAFYSGHLAVSARAGMLKTYELMERHFGWDTPPHRPPRRATDKQTADYLLDRALAAQGLVGLDSVCYLNAHQKPLVREAIEARVRAKKLVAAVVDGAPPQWIRPAVLADLPAPSRHAHILSPFDPLVIQRKRLKAFFGYEHRFEAYLPKEKRVFGYFGLPVLVDGEIVAVLDIKADRGERRLLLRQWTWVGGGSAARHQGRIDELLERFARFQFGA